MSSEPDTFFLFFCAFHRGVLFVYSLCCFHSKTNTKLIVWLLSDLFSIIYWRRNTQLISFTGWVWAKDFLIVANAYWRLHLIWAIAGGNLCWRVQCDLWTDRTSKQTPNDQNGIGKFVRMNPIDCYQHISFEFILSYRHLFCCGVAIKRCANCTFALRLCSIKTNKKVAFVVSSPGNCTHVYGFTHLPHAHRHSRTHTSTNHMSKTNAE